MEPIYKVTGHDTLQQMETNGRDKLFFVNGWVVWALNRETALWIADDHANRVSA